MSDSVSLLGPARERASRGDLALHDHVCGIYESRAEQYEPACRFLKIGLERNEQCLYVSENLTPADFMSLIAERGVDTKQATKAGSLLVLSGKDLRLLLGGFTPEAMFAFLARAEKNALDAGFRGFRWAADMTWLSKDAIEPSDMFSFEAQLNSFLAEHELAAFCQYAMDDFSPELLIAAAETHPLLVYSELVCDNFYYMPPEEYLKPGFAARKLKRLLFNIITREQLMQGFLR